MRVEFSSQAARDALNPAANTGRLINLYREPLVPGGKAGFQLRAVLGMDPLANVNRAIMRALMPYKGDLLTICGGVLSSVNSAGAASDIGTVGVSAETGIAENTGYATIVANGDYWTWDGTTLDAVDPGFQVGSVCYIGGYTVVTELNGRRLAWSDLADPTSFDGLNFASAEVNNDPIIRAVVVKDALFVFKRSGFEVWNVTGAAGTEALQRIPGAMEETGLRDYALVTTFPNGLAFVGSDGKVHLSAGGMRPISTPPVEVALKKYAPRAMFYYEIRGHMFLCISFQNSTAWCYDISTGEWHERSENDGPWTATHSTYWNDAWRVGADTGQVSTLSDACRDNGQPMIRRAVSLPLALGKPFTVRSLAIYPVVGVHRQNDAASLLQDGDSLLSPGGALGLGWWQDGRQAQIGLRTSRDGQTFGAEKVRGLGEPGAFRTWVEYRNLGTFLRVASFEVVLSSSVDIPLLSAAEVDIQ